MKEKLDLQLAQLVKMHNPSAVFEEVKNNFIRYYHINDFIVVNRAFKDFNDLMDGRYPGYRGCNTKFHDKTHTTDALLAISRLIDGYNIENKSKIPLKSVQIALVSTIMHDSGYIQKKTDAKGTGAKYTLNHVERSIMFLEKHLKKIGFSKSDFYQSRDMVKCTGLDTNIDKIKFKNNYNKILGQMLGTSDILGQMSSRVYLEKLVYLYHEFKEGNVGGYASEFDLLAKTVKFYEFMTSKLIKDLGDVRKYTKVHFKHRYKINRDLYNIAIQRQLMYLREEILKDKNKLYREKLRRKI